MNLIKQTYICTTNLQYLDTTVVVYRSQATSLVTSLCNRARIYVVRIDTVVRPWQFLCTVVVRIRTVTVTDQVQTGLAVFFPFTLPNSCQSAAFDELNYNMVVQHHVRKGPVFDIPS